MARWIVIGHKPHRACQTAEQRRNDWKGSGCHHCDYTGLEEIGYWAS